MTSSLTIPKKSSIALNNMRGLAAFYVMLGHFGVIASIVGFFPDVELFYFIPDPVGIFFLISGILIPISLQKHGFNSFATHRFFRIFPILFSISLFHVLFLGVSSKKIIGFFTTSTLTFDIFALPPLNIVYWTLAVEIHMYILVAVFYKFRPKIDAIFLYSVIAILFSFYCFSVLIGNDILLSAVSRNLSFITFILIGSSFLLKNKIHAIAISLLYLIFTIFCTQQGFGIANPDDKYMLIDVQDYGKMYKHVIYNLLPTLVWFLIGLRFFTMKTRFFDFLANISYPLYLVHVTVMMKIGVENGYKIILCIALSIIFALIFHLKIERRFVEYAKKYR